MELVKVYFVEDVTITQLRGLQNGNSLWYKCFHIKWELSRWTFYGAQIYFKKYEWNPLSQNPTSMLK